MHRACSRVVLCYNSTKPAFLGHSRQHSPFLFSLQKATDPLAALTRPDKMSTGELFMIQPEELKFNFELKKPLRCSLHLINKTNGHVAFKVWMTNPKKYEVKPNIGVLPPGSEFDITVTMQAQEETPSATLSEDKFLLQHFITTTRASHFEDTWPEMLRGIERNMVKQHLLEVIYVLPEHSQSSASKDPATSAAAPGKEESTQGGVDHDSTTRDLEDKLKDKEELIDLLLRRLEDEQKKFDNLKREFDDLKRTIEPLENMSRMPQYSTFSYIELQQATNDFENSLKIGEGGYGSVYKGSLRHITVAVKRLDSESMQGLPEFYQEVDILTRMRHPNLINLMGACATPEPCLVYEYLPNGSLEDRLSCKGNVPPLGWQARVRIATEICSALIFLHSHKPHGIVHGDLKPSNILLDANLVTKLSDFGICRILSQSSTTTEIHRTEPKGTYTYLDPEFMHNGELTLSSDVYAFGVIILQLLTGKPALGLVRTVTDALTSENLSSILDQSAGDWPFLQAKRLAHLGMECCKMNRRNRPRLETEVWRVLEPMMRASSAPQLKQENDSCAPSYFFCPILQEIMKDPHVAADGFTYEAEAIKAWFDGGHNTSPMTNIEVPHHELLPNHALRSVIQEWLQLQHH